MTSFYVVEFGPTKKIKNATKAAKFLREHLGVKNRLLGGDSNYAPEGGFAYLQDQTYWYDRIRVVRDITSCWLFERNNTLIFLTGDKEIVGKV